MFVTPLVVTCGARDGLGDLPEETRSCQAGQAGPQCQGRGSQGLIHRRIPDITQALKNTETQRLCHHSEVNIIDDENGQTVLLSSELILDLLITNHWLWWSCEDLQIILWDKSVKSPGGKQDHNGLRSASQAEMKQWSQSLIECRSLDLRDLRNSH